MSWGERTCKYNHYPFSEERPCKATPLNCNKECFLYFPVEKDDDEEKNTGLLSKEELRQRTLENLIELSKLKKEKLN